VTHIVDHHFDNELYQDNIYEREIEKVGSSCTLVARKMLKKLEKLNDEEKAEFAMFLSAPISLDTYNFHQDLKGNKWKEEDSKSF